MPNCKISNLIKLKKTVILSITVLVCVNTSAQSISAGAAHSLYTCTNNIVITCGFNSTGQLGDGTTTSTSTPIQINSLSGIIATAGGYHSLFLKNDGTVFSCGYNGSGQLGDGTTFNSSTPAQISSLTGINKIAVGNGNFSLFLKNNGTVWSCGYNAKGQLGNGTSDMSSHTIPIQISGLNNITNISAGLSHSLFLKNDSTVWACGDNIAGTLGDGTVIQKNAPIQVSGLGKIIAIATGGTHSIFLKKDGTVWTCGYNNYGQLGIGSADNSTHTIPSQVIGLTGIIAMAGGDQHSLFLKNDGTVWACGNNIYGQLGDGTTTQKSTPVQIPSLIGVIAIASSYNHSIFLKNDGTVWVCGWNSNGQLGNGSTDNLSHPTPIQVSGLCGNTVGLSDYFNENSISIYPNPFENQLIINLSEGNQNTLKKITFSNNLGQIIYLIEFYQNNTTLNLSQIPSGVYIVTLIDKEINFRTKLIKQ